MRSFSAAPGTCRRRSRNSRSRLTGKHAEQRDGADDVGEQDGVVPATEDLGVLDGLREQREAGQARGEARRERQAAARALLRTHRPFVPVALQAEAAVPERQHLQRPGQCLLIEHGAHGDVVGLALAERRAARAIGRLCTRPSALRAPNSVPWEVGSRSSG